MTTDPHLADLADLADFDVRLIPFSTRGAWFDLSTTVGWHQHREELTLVSHRNGIHGVLALRPERAGVPAGTRWEANPARLTWVADDEARIEAVFDGPEVLRLRGTGLGLRVADAAGTLTPHTGSYLFVEPLDGAAVFTSYETGRRYRLSSLSGGFDVVGAESLGQSERAVVLGADGLPWEVALQEMTTAAPAYTAPWSFAEAEQRTAEAFVDYLDALAPWRDERTPAAALAGYVLWSATVAPEGFVTRETILMSKHWMDKLWSWDHCFNADALAPGLPDGALDQFFAPFDHLDDAGAMPDSTAHSELLLNYVKPPIHGWALRRVRSRLGRELTRGELEHALDVLSRWTLFWLDSRRAPDSPLAYYQHGNDSGWDNATTFDLDRVIEAPDLAAFLVLQLEVVTDLAEELGQPAARWKQLRDEMLDALLDLLWTDDGFVGRGAHNHRASTTGRSLLRLLPIVLADRLPAAVRDRLAADVAGHLTEHGLATEHPASEHYEDDGYWRGPIWAPSTALVEDGLRRAGYTDLADTVNQRFRRLCETSGFAENFDARTGAGLRDRAYTWTASVYLSMSRDHVDRTRSL